MCVVGDDSVFLTLSAACLSESSLIISMLPGLRDVGSRYLESVAPFNHVFENRIKVIGKKAACLTVDNLYNRKARFYTHSSCLLPSQMTVFHGFVLFSIKSFLVQ